MAAGCSQPTSHILSRQNTRELGLHVLNHEAGTRFLVDSGSILSLLPHSLVQQKSPLQALKLTAANGSSIATYGQHVRTIDLGLRRTFTWAFTVGDVKSAVLGADFLSHFDLVVNLKRRCVVDAAMPSQADGQPRKTSIYGISVVSPTLHTSEGLQPRLADIAARFATLLQPHSAPESGPAAAVQHHIVTTGPPVFSRPRRLMGDKLSAAKQSFDMLLYRGIIKPSSSQWASPLHLVARANGGWRATGDYRRLNAITVPDQYPLPRIEDLLRSLHGSKIFTKLDLNKAYFQVPVAPEDVPKTAMTTPFGLFEFIGMPLGLRNATQTFNDIWTRCFVTLLSFTTT